MKNQIKQKQNAKLAKEIDQDHQYWNRLEEMQDRLSTKWLKETIEEALDRRIGHDLAADINSIFKMEGLFMSDKHCLIYLITQHHLGKKEIPALEFMKAVGMSRKGFGDVTRRLVPAGMIIRIRQGYYKLNDKQLF